MKETKHIEVIVPYGAFGADEDYLIEAILRPLQNLMVTREVGL